MRGRGKPGSARSVLLVPVLVWAGLCFVLALTFAYAYWPGAPGKPAAGLFLAFCKAALIVLFFMQLTRSSALVRVTALAGLVWLSIMFLLSFSDVLTRT